MKTSKRLVIIGMDGLDPNLLERYMQEGILPHFKKLAAEGANMRLKTSNPPQSPVAWSNFISGSNPGKHDVFDFIVRDPSNYMPEIGMTENKKGGFKEMFAGLTGPAVVTRRKGQAFWDLLGANGITSTIVRCPVTFPAQPLEGRMLTGMGTPDIRGTQGIFTFYSTRHVENEKDIHGRLIHVTWEKNEIKTFLPGPRVKTVAGKSEEKTIPIVVRKKSDGVIQLTVQDTTRELKVEDWSDWFTVSFKMNMVQSVSGIVRFHLNAIGPEFELYASPVNIDPKNPAMPISYPDSYAGDMCDHVGLYHTQGMPYDTWALNEGKLTEEEFLNQAYHIFNENLQMMRYELGRFKSGVLFNYFGVTDLIQHMFWRYEDPNHPNKGKSTDPKVKNAIRDVYVKMDQVLGEVQEKIGKDTGLIVMSDHGFGSFRRAVHVNSWLRDNGFLVFKNDEVEGKELFLNVDWSQTQAYGVGFGGIYINQTARERNGVVYKGAETDKLKKEITEKLRAWKDKDGTPVVKKVYDSSEMYNGPYSGNGPDLYIGFNLPFRASWQTGLGAAPKALVEDNMKMWGGDHLCDPSLVPGVLITNLSWKSKDAGLTDLFPTILDYFDVSLQGDFEGHPIR